MNSVQCRQMNNGIHSRHSFVDISKTAYVASMEVDIIRGIGCYVKGNDCMVALERAHHLLTKVAVGAGDHDPH